MPTARRLRLGVLISGGGSTLANLIERIADSRLRNVQIAQVVSSRAAVRGVEIARRAALPVAVIRPADFASPEGFDTSLADLLDLSTCELIAMAGFLVLWRFPQRFAGRVLNIHPAMLPKFGGAGMYGRHVHAAVLAAGETESGCTVHLADHQYDHGPIVAQRRVPVLPGDTPETLAARVAIAERELYPEVIQTIADRGLAWLPTALNRTPTVRAGPDLETHRNS
jgi:formyltetrahydrofolate-dependent phosphoribosylglycinamide formyltransferase